MRQPNVLSWALLGLCVVVALSADQTDTQTTESIEDTLGEIAFIATITQEANANTNTADETGARKKRQVVYRAYPSLNPWGRSVDYLGLGLGFQRSNYQYFPKTFGYTSRYSSYYPEDLRLNIYRLPISRFFNSFYPGPIVRPADGVVTRTFFRTGSYQNALADFRLFPLQQVRTITTTSTRTDVAEPGFVGTFRDIPYEVRVCSDCCTDGYPCITFTGQTAPFRKVVRNFVYTRNTRSVSSYNDVYPVV
ncbi:hypothetical protein SNE40_001396 [Patella caerulea]|uniref:Uncharacterized protein n=1 Tax=Patella caerulea TaxID=87958 RepID=A0AAN8Q3G7_PATCE